MAARCCFYIFNRDDPKESRSLWVRGPGSGLILDEAPAVGDLILLSGDIEDPADETEERMIEVHGVWRVIARQWMPADYGSVVWNQGDRSPEPTSVDLMLEPAEGLFAASTYERPTR